MRRSAVVLAVLLAACTDPAPAASEIVAAPTPPPTVPTTSSAPETTDGRPGLSLSIDARPIAAGGCARASVSITHGRARVGLEWRTAGARWAPWPVGPERRTHRGVATLRACPGWSAGPLEVRAVGPGASSSTPARIHRRGDPWMRRLDRLVGDRPMSVSVMVDGAFVYGHLPLVRRAPASNEKVLLSMALLDRFGPDRRIATVAATQGRVGDGVVHGDLYLVGDGDPELDDADVHRLAERLRAAGLRRVDGAVVGDTGTFERDRDAIGWHPIALRYIGLPTALSFRRNVDAHGFVFDPERVAAAALGADLRDLGVRVGSASARSDRAPDDLRTIAAVRSGPLSAILRRQNVDSINLDAETLSKMLATDALGRPGSIAGGARTIQRWANALGAGTTLHDASGLSYRDRVSTASMTALLDHALRTSWGDDLVATLPRPSEGTLAGRLAGLDVRAKTGTLIRDVSALSGYVRLRDGRWATFSIMSALPKGEAVGLEDAIVRTIEASV